LFLLNSDSRIVGAHPAEADALLEVTERLKKELERWRESTRKQKRGIASNSTSREGQSFAGLFNQPARL
jgi:hypothetical protein